MLNVKYTDVDVRQDERLIQIAYAYLERYQGEFDFLVKAKNMLALGAELSTGTIRGVLNCMRTDPIGYTMLPQTPTGRLALVHPPPLATVSAMPPLQLVAEPRRDDVTLKTRWHMRYVLSMHKTASVAHILRKEACALIWVPQDKPFRARWGSPWQGSFVEIRFPWHNGMIACRTGLWCQRRLYSEFMLSHTPEGRRICQVCIHREDVDKMGPITQGAA